jgi:hypothetical protein
MDRSVAQVRHTQHLKSLKVAICCDGELGRADYHYIEIKECLVGFERASNNALVCEWKTERNDSELPIIQNGLYSAREVFLTLCVSIPSGGNSPLTV